MEVYTSGHTQVVVLVFDRSRTLSFSAGANAVSDAVVNLIVNEFVSATSQPALFIFFIFCNGPGIVFSKNDPNKWSTALMA